MTWMLLPWLLFIFIAGAAVGSFLNVCIYRIPYEKSLFWPASCCGSCLKPVRIYDNLPLLSYLLLRGRCRRCQARFSSRYFFIELGTGLAFVALFYLEILKNIHHFAVLEREQFYLSYGLVPWQGWVIFCFHAILLGFLLVTTFTDIDHMEIPLSITVTGMAVGLIGSVLFPWPFPNTPADQVWIRVPGPTLMPRTGLYPWPVWHTLPAWMPLGSRLAGLATGLAGVLAGMAVLRAIAFLFKIGRGKEGLGIGDADLMMMVGAFLGWQVVLVAFFVSVFPALLFGIMQLVLRGEKPMPFGPSLAAGTVITWLCWDWIAPHVHPVLSDWLTLVLLSGAGAMAFFVLSVIFRLRGSDPPEEGDKVAGAS
jgi:leader peptidase (prepilin peptidase) / N-methyltransferase